MRRLIHIAPWALAGVVLVAAFAFLFRGEVMASRDLAAHVFPETAYLIERWSQGEIAWWLPNARLGQPFAALLYTQVFYAPRVVTALIFGAVRGPNVMHLFHAAWGFAGSFFALRRFGRSRAAAFVGAASFSLSPFFIELAQNLSFASVAAWFGWAAWAAQGLRRQPTLHTMAVLAVVMGFAFHAGAPEIWLQIAMVVAVTVPRVRTAVSLAWGGAIGAVVALPALWLAREWTMPGERLKGALEWSLSLPQVLSIGIPDAATPLADGYWGGDDQRFIYTLFIGSLAVLLAVIGASARRARPLAIIGAVLLALALGRHFVLTQLVLELPPFSLFRYPAKYAIGALWVVSMLAGFGVDRLSALARRERSSIWLATLVGLVVGLFIASRFEVREGFRAHAPWVLGAVVLLVLARRWKWVLAIAVAGELIGSPIERWERTRAAELERPSLLAGVLRDEPRISIRVDLDDVDRQACGPWDLDDAGGSARDRLTGLQFMREGLSAVGGYGFRDPWRLSRALSSGPSAVALVGVNAFVRETWAPAPPGVSSVTLTPIEDVWVWHSTQRVPPGFFVQGVTVSGDDAAFSALKGSVESLRRTVHVDQGTEFPSGDAPAVDVTTSRVSPERVEQTVNAPVDGVVVLTDAWDPGWVVEVDGKKSQPLRAWGFVRAVEVTRGEHQIVWRYRPVAARIGAVISSLAAVLAIAFALTRSRKR